MSKVVKGLVYCSKCRVHLRSEVEELLSRVDTMATAGRLEEAVEQLSGTQQMLPSDVKVWDLKRWSLYLGICSPSLFCLVFGMWEAFLEFRAFPKHVPSTLFFCGNSHPCWVAKAWLGKEDTPGAAVRWQVSVVKHFTKCLFGWGIRWNLDLEIGLQDLQALLRSKGDQCVWVGKGDLNCSVELWIGLLWIAILVAVDKPWQAAKGTYSPRYSIAAVGLSGVDQAEGKHHHLAQEP